ncbi:MAG TPA: helix-turn-helix domain-containing protein [Solirubrobacterales bacterium]|nr:helix-turn-helix domain-containing protein [Solirubrobacterales bacterium]
MNGYSNGHAGNGNGGHRAAANGNGNGASSLPVNWERLARATAHPLRVSILEILGIDGGRTMSPSDLCRELQIPLSNTNYHVTELAKANLIELVRERQVRGATEHFYRLPISAAKPSMPEAAQPARELTLALQR